MRAVGRLIFLIIVVVGAWLFLHRWHSTTPWAVGTGNIGGKSVGTQTHNPKPVARQSHDLLHEIAQNPTRYKDKKVTVTGRVHGTTKYASNRNMYSLYNGPDRILVIDDKKAPEMDRLRTVSGVVKVIGPSVGGLNYAYLVDVKQGVRYDEPKWGDVAHFFTDKFEDIKEGFKEETHGR
jgi:hypothetical protein